MQRIGVAWLLGLPLAVLGWLSAHAVAYDVAFPSAHERADALAASGHDYLERAPLLAAVCVVVAAGGFLLRARGRSSRPLPAWALGLLPLVGFAVQEHVERALHAGAIPWGTGLEPVFLVGLALQLPFAVLAGLVARAFTGLADILAVQSVERLRVARCTFLPVPAAADPRPTTALASGHAGRAPPPRV
jgi:hypothetical protein